MADKYSRVEYRWVRIPDRPGEVARVLAALREHGVSFLSVTAFPRGAGTVQLDVVPCQGDLERAAAKENITLGPRKQAFFVQGPDRPGAAAEILGKLAQEKIHVIATQALCAETGFGMIVWVKPAEVEAAARAFGI